MKKFFGSAWILAFGLASAGLHADEGKPAAKVAFAAKILRVKSKAFLDVLCGSESASVQTVFEKEGMEKLGRALATASVVKAGTCEGSFSEVQHLEALEEKEYVFGVDVEVGSGGVSASPIPGKTRWGIQLQLTPISLDAAGRVVAYVDCWFSAPLAMEHAEVSRVKFDLPHAIERHCITRVAIPPDGAVILGNSAPGDPDEMFVLEVQATASGAAAATGDPGAAGGSRSMTTLLVLQKKPELDRVPREGGSGELAAGEAGKVRKSGKPAEISFFPIDPALAGEDRVAEPDRFIQTYEEVSAAGKKEWEPAIGTLGANVIVRLLPKGAARLAVEVTVHHPKWPLRIRKHAASGRVVTDPEYLEGKASGECTVGTGGAKAYLWEVTNVGGAFVASVIVSVE